MANTTLNFTLTDDADLPVDADTVPVLRDVDAVYGVKRTDTSAVVVAAGTAMVRDSTGVYHYTFTDPEAGLTYIYSVEYAYGGETNWIVDEREAGGSVAWYYAEQIDVEGLIHTLNTNVAFDLDDDGNIDADSVQRAGTAMDGYIDLKLRRAGLTAPNPLTDTAIAAVLRQASAHLVVWYGFHQRGLDSSTLGDRFQGIAGIMEGYKAYADELLVGVIEVLAAEDSDDDTTSLGAFGFVPVVRECVSATDENSN